MRRLRRKRVHDDSASNASDMSEQDSDPWGGGVSTMGGGSFNTSSTHRRSSDSSSVSEADSESEGGATDSVGPSTNASRASKGSSSSSTSSSPTRGKGRRKPTGSFGSRGDMLDDGAISKAKQAQLDKELKTVDAVISEMSAMALSAEESILYVMTNSVDVQRIATLQQMSKHVDNEDPTSKDTRFRLLLHLLVNIASYTPPVQVACAAGIADMLPTLEAEIKHAIYSHTKRVIFAVDATAFTSWCNLFFLSIKHVSADVLRGDVFDFLAAMTETRMSEKERRFGCKLITAITETDASLAWRLLGLVQKLATDPLPSVRRSLTETLWPVLEALPRVSVREECIVNPLSRLLLDTNMEVSARTFKVMVKLCTVMDEGFVSTFLFPVLLRYTINAPPAAQDVVYASFGRVVYHSRKCFTKTDFENVLMVYTRMCRNSNEQCRKHCASNFLAMCATFNNRPSLLPKVLDLLTSFVADTSVVVRRSIAAGYHELFGLVLGNVPAVSPYSTSPLTSASNQPMDVEGGVGTQLMGLGGDGASTSSNGVSGGATVVSGALALLVAEEDQQENTHTLLTQIKMVQANALQLMDDTDITVRERLFNHVGVYLRSFSDMYQWDLAERRRVLDTVIPPLMKFEQAITANWRKLSHLLTYFDTFPKYFSFDRLEKDLVPILVGHLVNGAVALKKKIAVTIATFLHTCGTREEAERTSRAIHVLVRSLLRGSSQHRIAYIIFAEGMASVFSSHFVAMYLYPPLCRLREDSVPNVRSHLASLLPSLLTLPAVARRVETDFVVPLSRDGDAVVAAKARAASDSARAALEGADERDALLAKHEAILLSKEVFRAGMEEAHAQASAAAALGNSPAAATTSPMHTSLDGDVASGRRRTRSPGRHR